MKFYSAASLLLVGATAVQGFRDQTQKKHDHRRLDQTCTVNHDIAQSAKEISVDVVGIPRNGNGYFDIKINDPPYAEPGKSVTTSGWCIDYDRRIWTGKFMMDVFSAYDDDIHVGAVDKPERLPNLGWLINNVNIGDVYPPQGRCPGGTVRWEEIQGAVWKVIDHKDGTGTQYAYGRVDCLSEILAQRAIREGANYQPDCNDPNEQIPLVFVVDRDRDGKIMNQVIMSETKLSSVQGLCECDGPDVKTVDEPVCELPEDAKKYSLVTTTSARVGAHSMYKGIAIGGTLTDGTPNESGTVDRTMSYINNKEGTVRLNFNAGVKYGATDVPASMWKQFEYLATHAKSSSSNGKKVFVVTKGGTYDMCDFLDQNAQGYDNGNTLVIFNTSEDVVITKTDHGRQFGPSIIAPFSKVTVLGDAGFVDGSIYSKSFVTSGRGEGSLQLHGATYSGPISCVTTVEPPKTNKPTSKPTGSPTDKPTPTPTNKPTPAPTNKPTPAPTNKPTPGPTNKPTPGPTNKPTPGPTNKPTPGPTNKPTPGPTNKPTPGPTNKPTPGPTNKPTPGPTNKPTNPPDEEMTVTSPPGTKGDPHFKTHGGEMYDFHGGCDLVLLDNPEFHAGLGMLIHIRTKIETWWSYVESAVVRIGDETLEINGGGKGQWLYTNGVANEPLEDKKWHHTEFAGLTLRYKQTGPNSEAHIYLGNGEKLLMKTYNDFVKVEIAAEGSEYYKGSHGLLGRFPDGKRVARDGVTFIEDVNAFGKEWQVLPEEPQLFHTYEDEWVVPAGHSCAMPVDTLEKKQLRQRRLENGMPMQEAEKACAHLESADDRKACVFDVVATQDVNMASVW